MPGYDACTAKDLLHSLMCSTFVPYAAVLMSLFKDTMEDPRVKSQPNAANPILIFTLRRCAAISTSLHLWHLHQITALHMKACLF